MPELEIHTVIVDGNPQSLDTALTRSILGVTYRKFTRKKTELNKNWDHNNKITKKISSCLYESIKANTNLDMDNYKVKIDLTLKWDASGKILGISNIVVSIFLKIGELKIAEVAPKPDLSPLKIDLFYSTIDVSSEILKTKIPELVHERKEKIIYTEYDFQNPDNKNIIDAHKICKVPSVVIDDKVFENPTIDKIRSEISDSFSPNVEASVGVFKKETKENAIRELAQILRKA